MDEVAEILEDDLIAITAVSVLYLQITGDSGIVDSLRRISDAMKHIEVGEVRVVKGQGRLDPNIKARMRMAEAFMEMEGRDG